MKIKCPTCKKRTTWEENPQRPFCSERCKLIDLGKWATDEYRVSSRLEDESEMSREEEKEI